METESPSLTPESITSHIPWITPEHLDFIVKTLSLYIPKLVAAILTLIIGFWIAGRIKKMVAKAFLKVDFDEAVEHFIESLVGFTIKIVVVLAALNLVGIPMASFLAVLGAAGLAVGLALQGSLSNFAGGVLILIFKPFRLGDLIEAQGYLGKVSAISVVSTTLITGDNKTIIIPNGGLAGAAVTNYSTQKTRRLEWNVGIAYTDSIDDAKSVLKDIIQKDKRILQKEDQLFAVSELGDSAVIIKVRAWVKAADYWGTFFDTNEVIKKTFDKKGLNFPFPQQDVHMFNEKN